MRVLLTAVLLLGLGQAHAGDWEKSVASAARLHQQGKLKQAEAQLLKTLYTAEAYGEADPRLAYTLDYLGTLNMQMNEADKAAPLFERAVRAFKVSRGEAAEETWEATERLAGSYDALEQYAKSEPLYRALAASGRGDALQKSADLNSLAVSLDAQGKMDQALELYQQALAIRETNFGPEADSLPEILNNIGRVYYLKANYAAAEPLYERAIRIDEATLKAGDPQLAEDYGRLAALYAKTGRQSMADALQAKAAAPILKKKKP